MTIKDRYERNYLKRYRNSIKIVARLESKRKGITDPEEIQDIDRRIQARQSKADALRSKLVILFNNLDTDKERRALMHYFIDCMSIPSIAESMNISERHTWRLYSNGIHKLVNQTEKNDGQ